MKAVILAAGIGNRLFPYTKEMPKCLLAINGMAILEHQIKALRKNSIEDIVIVIGHEGEKIADFAKSSRLLKGINIKFIRNERYKMTNSSYSLWLASDEIKDGFIYLNSDLIFDPELLGKLLKSGYEDCIIINRKANQPDDMFKVKMENNRILHMDKEMEEEDINAEAVGPAKFSRDGAKAIIEKLNELVEGGDYSNWCYKIFSDISKKHAFYGVDCEDLFWVEIDNAEDLEFARKKLKGKSMFKAFN